MRQRRTESTRSRTPHQRRRPAWARLAVWAGASWLLAVGPALAAEPAWQPGKPVLKATKHCTWGPPARVDGRLVVPKACRIQLGKRAVVRHSVEIRDITTGKRLAQASLPSAPAAGDAPPQVGAILGGPYPLYVHSGGVAAVAVRARRMEAVHEAEGTLVGLARHGEVLAVVERVPAGEGASATVWSLLDFGNGQELGTARLAAGAVVAVGFEARGKALDATLQLRAKGDNELVFRHALRDAKGAHAPVSPQFAPKAQTVHRPEQAPRPCATAPTRACATLLDPALSVLPERPELRIGPAGCVTHPPARTETLTLAEPTRCAAVLAPRGVDPGWAWLQRPVEQAPARGKADRGKADRGGAPWLLAPLTQAK
jgi:hypothetical protein